MLVPLSWLADYVSLPESAEELTDRLTMIGHMLDKRFEVDGDTVIDLELRGNRSDMFGLIGIARDVAAAFDRPLTMPPTTLLPTSSPHSRLVTVEAPELVERFLAFELRVKVAPSPDWLVRRLSFFGIPSINNVVDLTNYCMLETGEPMHAYDRTKLAGNRLILRRAIAGETMTTLLGKQATLSPEELVICDEKGPQALPIIGGRDSAITDATEEILLEAAVYNQANIRRSARSLNIRTDAGTRHEKLLDPNQVPLALERALYLLQKYANAQVIGPACDYYPQPVEPPKITLPLADITRLTGTAVPMQEAQQILSRLGCKVEIVNNSLEVVTPTFRTDIEQAADLVEEVIRIYGYDKIPLRSLQGAVPEPAPSAMWLLEEQVRDLLLALQCNEVITSSLMRNNAVNLYRQERLASLPIVLENAPDSELATLRPSLLPNLVEYARRSISFRQKRISYFEVGKVYIQHTQGEYREETFVGMITGGEIDTRLWNRQPRPLTIYDVKGLVEGLCKGVGVGYSVEASSSHPAIDPVFQGVFRADQGQLLGWFGQLHQSITRAQGINQPLFVAELSLDTILQLPKATSHPYTMVSPYPPVIEDLSFIVPSRFQVGQFMEAIKGLSTLIEDISLLDVFDDSRAFRITYAAADRTLSTEEIKSVREQVIRFAADRFSMSLKLKSVSTLPKQ